MPALSSGGSPWSLIDRAPRRGAADFSGRTPRQCPEPGGDLAVVEGDLAAASELLALLVALAGDQDGVARPGHGQGGPTARRSTSTRYPSGPAPAATLGDLSDDRLRGLGARVVGGRLRPGRPGRLAISPSERSLGPVAVAAAAEDHDHLSLGDRPRRPEDVVEEPGCGRSRPAR